MKFSVNSADLLRALTTVSGAVPTKSTLPILESVLFERDGDALRLCATDLEVAIVQRLAVQFEGEVTDRADRIAVPAKRLLDTVRALPELPVEFSSDDDHQIVLKTDQGRYQMIGHDGGDYPAIPELEADAQVDVDDALVKRAIQKTSFAVSKDALRPAMMGIYFQIGPDGGRTVATDGHRLVRMNMEALKADEPLSFIVPEKALGLAARSAGQGAGCKIRVSQSHVGFDFGATQVRARLIDESYPNYEAVIPKENERTMTVGRDAMLAAAKRVSLYSSNMTNQIRLELSEGTVKIAAEDIERSSQAHETVLCEYDSEPMTIGFNANYLTEVLSNVSAEDIVFAFSSPNRAGVVTPGDQPSGEDILMLIMPVMLNTYA